MNQKYFEENILPFKNKLYRIALRITANAPEAEDIVQDVMMRMWQLREQWNTIDNKEAYCCMMSRNIALSRISLKDNEKGRPDSAEISIKADSTPSDELETKERMGMLREFIGRLPGHEKAVMELRDIEGMPYKDIAFTLNINEGQVKVNLYRARQKIKEYFHRTDSYINTGKKVI